MRFEAARRPADGCLAAERELGHSRTKFREIYLENYYGLI